VGISQDNQERGGFLVLFLLLAVVSLAVLGFGPNAGGAQQQEAGPQVTGDGKAVFPSTTGPGGVPACTFTIDASQDETGPHGTFTCELSDDAIALGFPFTNIDAQVTNVEAPSEEEATVEGSALVQLPDGGSLQDIPAQLEVHAGGPSTGTLRFHLEGVFDGDVGDELPGDGDYSLLKETVTEGSIVISPEGPGPSPSPTGSPSPSPTVSPSPSPTPTSSPTPSPHPSPTTSHLPPVPPTLRPPAVPPSPPIRDVPFTLGGTQSTARLMSILAQLSPDGIPRLDEVLSVVGPFPVAGLAWWQNDWHAPRCCPYPHLHQGLDMFAPRGTPVVAAADGSVSQKVDGLISGLAVEITDAGNTQYFYAHLSGFGPDIEVGSRVHVGQVLGYVGNTGNAAETSPHLHFEVQPNGVPVPPMPIVAGWLRLAEDRATALFVQRTGRSPLDLATLRVWIQKALALAASRNSGQETGDEATLGGARSRRPAVGLLDLHRAGPLVAFAGGALLILIIFPAVLAGRRDARRRWRPAPKRGRQPAGPAAEEAGASAEHDRPGGLGRQRPAAR
jgi:peptidoglycan LD-endopeptidase LytH